MTTAPEHVSIMKEIEYKYFVDINKLKNYLSKYQSTATKIEDIQQHYIAKNDHNTVRLRVSVAGNAVERVLCVKTKGSEFNEIEQSVSDEFANAILSDQVVTSKVDKCRVTFPLTVRSQPLKLEVDIYKNEWEGLSVAEIEVPVAGFEIPSWALPDFIIRQMGDDETSIFSNFSLSVMNTLTRELLLEDLNNMGAQLA